MLVIKKNRRVHHSESAPKRERVSLPGKEERRRGRALPVLEPLFELLDLTLVATDIGKALRRILGRPELRQVFSVGGAQLAVRASGLSVPEKRKQ